MAKFQAVNENKTMNKMLRYVPQLKKEATSIKACWKEPYGIEVYQVDVFISGLFALKLIRSVPLNHD